LPSIYLTNICRSEISGYVAGLVEVCNGHVRTVPFLFNLPGGLQTFKNLTSSIHVFARLIFPLYRLLVSSSHHIASYNNRGKMLSVISQSESCQQSHVSPLPNAISIPPAASVTNINDHDSSPLTVDDLMRTRCQLSPNHAIVSYPSSGLNYVDYTPRQLDMFAFRAAEQYALRIPSRRSSDEKPRVIGLLGPSNLDYLITLLALSKLGHTVLFLSTRISKEAYLSLLNTTRSQNIVIHSSFRDMTTRLQAELPTLQVDELVGEKIYNYAVGPPVETRMDQGLDIRKESRNIAWIIHSSGSTGMPKPVSELLITLHYGGTDRGSDISDS
jgi:hypothetical protein